ncbi:DUF1569 domain-containing protein [Nonlabens mediterrranea]|uniref:DUF1569 domain-containing protein n=1 Tax=Nonlabens mediterrranea TaxID=1419947 RepID=A0ABS0A775_9FLAO|nr:DUF1569 domain-containing protein [Nonlabens mediterrranea]
MKKLQQQLTELQKFIELGDLNNNKVSKVGTYWHIDHALRVFIGIPQALESSDPQNFEPKWSFLKWTIMTFKKIPRGKGRAPKHVLPVEHITKTDLLQQIQLAENGLENFEQLNPQSYFKHPLFGHLDLKESQKFLAIHTEHHLKIIRDITK